MRIVSTLNFLQINSWSGSVEIGVTTCDPDLSRFPSSATDLRDGSWVRFFTLYNIIIFSYISSMLDWPVHGQKLSTGMSNREQSLLFVHFISYPIITSNGKHMKDIGFYVLMAVTMKGEVFWVVELCTLERAQCFRGTYHLHLQG
jgi:hypothetical protein